MSSSDDELISSSRSGSVRPSRNCRRKDHQSDMLNPFNMHPRDNPGPRIVSPPLISNNYHSWSHAMKTALQSKNKIRFIDGTLLEQLHTPTYVYASDHNLSYNFLQNGST